MFRTRKSAVDRFLKSHQDTLPANGKTSLHTFFIQLKRRSIVLFAAIIVGIALLIGAIAYIVNRDADQVASVVSLPTLPLYVDPTNDATAYFTTHPGDSDAVLIGREGNIPTANWYGDWIKDPQTEIRQYVTAASKAKALPVIVLYDIPKRDCGLYSAGGAQDKAAYMSWVQQAVLGIGNRQAIVIVEPDALADLDCLSHGDQKARLSMLSDAIRLVKTNKESHVYLDAGNPAWQSSEVMIKRLHQAGITHADGFSLNISNFVTTHENQTYGTILSKALHDKHYVIDTSRNGNGGVPSGQWCNPAGRALGEDPTLNTGETRNDALLWIKTPWESDGSCHGAPAAGQNNWPYAVQLAKNIDL